MNRRDILRGAGVAALIPAAVIAAPRVTDPLPGYVAEWRKVKEENRNLPSELDDTEAEKEVWDRMERWEKLILTTAPTTAAGIAAQLEYALEEEICGKEFGGPFAGLDGQMFRQMIEALKSGDLMGRAA